jgi:cell division protein FtsL
MLAVTLVPAFRATINQQSQINELSEQLDQKRERVAALKLEERQWSDPAYVEQQARERLKFVRVGERSYTVIDAEVLSDGGGPSIAAPAQTGMANTAWYARLWQSMVIADNPAEAPTLAPGIVPTIPPAVPSR